MLYVFDFAMILLCWKEQLLLFLSVVHISPTEKIRFPPLDVSQLYYEFASELGRDIVYEPEMET